MTGLDRLRELADDMFEKDLWASIRGGLTDKYGTDLWDDKTVNGLLCEIADRIEAELAHGGDCVLARLWRKRLLDECADVIQATLNLVAALGVEDFRPYLKACEERNRERGRITK